MPVKRLAVAKTRLAATAGRHRRELALAFAADTVAAALACPGVSSVLVVTDEPDAARLLAGVGAVVVPDEPDDGLNPALLHGAAAAIAAHPDDAVGALSADLPALRPAELARALHAAPDDAACFVRDAEGSGTTALLARRPALFAPAFGAASARAHLARGVVELDPVGTGGLDSLRRDVDTAEHLRAAVALGVGPATARVVALLRRGAGQGARAAG